MSSCSNTALHLNGLNAVAKIIEVGKEYALINHVVEWNPIERHIDSRLIHTAEPHVAVVCKACA